jgi:urease accessory protein
VGFSGLRKEKFNPSPVRQTTGFVEMKPMLSASQRNALLLGILLCVPSLARAHVGVGQTSGFSHGFGHPLSGLDHVCAMVAVGLWAAQMGGRAIWAVPLTFVSVMAFGGFLGVLHVQIPFIETGIVISVLTLGVFIAAAVRMPLIASILIVGLFAIFHGHAHGEEMLEKASGLAYAVGFVLATALLHAIGIGLGIGIQRISKPLVVRLAGVAIVLCGIYIWVS